MSLDKLIAAATDYFSTGAEVHRRALAGGGGKITDFSDKSGHVTDVATKKVATKATKPAATEPTGADDAIAAEAAERAATAAREADARAAAELKARDAAAEAKAKAAAKVGPEDDGVGDLDDIPDFKIDAISYEEDIRPLIRTKSLANRDALVALLGKFNVKSGQELTADQYPAFLAGLKAI